MRKIKEKVSKKPHVVDMNGFKNGYEELPKRMIVKSIFSK